MVAKARRILDAPPRYLAQVKTDCLLTQRLPKRFTERLRALEALRHPDGTPVYRVEETKPLLSSRAPRMRRSAPNNGGGTRWTTQKATAWRATPCCSRACRAPERRTWPGPLRRGCESRARRCTWCPRRTAPRRTWAWGRRRPTTVRARGQRAKAGLAGGGGDHAAGHGTLGEPCLRGAERRREVPAAGRLPDSWAGRPISAPLEHSQLVRDMAGGHRHELTENMRSDPGIFNFVKWLRVGEEACPTLEQAKARLRELFPSKPGWPDTTLVISSKRMAVNAAANRALAPEA